MELRRRTRMFAGGALATAMRDLNARHPWSHNDYFHGWILANLPARRRAALDFGCGRGELLATLSPHFRDAVGADVDEAMRHFASQRCAGLSNVCVTGDALTDLGDEFDLITMIAALHHLDVASALQEVGRLVAPGGRFLAVGLAPPRTLRDHAWEVASIVTNPIIGYVRHPWPSKLGLEPPPFPVQDPAMPFDEVRDAVHAVMPGAKVRHQIGFRHTISWTKR